jgi:site-specific DNA-methyltransferase (adenine-specific)
VSGLYQGGRQDSTLRTWETPPAFFAALDAEFHFTLDAAALPKTAKVATFFSPETDALAQRWAGVVWVNPPYGQGVLSAWVAKAYEESRRGAIVVALVPARTDAHWWHEFALRAAEIRFVRGRIRFVGAASTAPFPSAVLVFRPPVFGSIEAENEGAARPDSTLPLFPEEVP